MIMALAPPPPLQMPAAPIFALCCLKMDVRAITILAPDTPSGCPKETAPPLTLTFSLVKLRIFIFAKPTTEKASFSSKKSTSSIEIPALSVL